MATIPAQAPGPGPTAQALPSYLSYSPAATNVLTYASTLTQVVYDPEGGFAPYQTTNIIEGTTTSVSYTVVNVPLLYTGPFPAPDLGTLYTTPGENLPSATQTNATPTAATSDVSSNNIPSTTAAPTAVTSDANGTADSSQSASMTAESIATTSAASASNTASATNGINTSAVPAPTISPPETTTSASPSAASSSSNTANNSSATTNPNSSNSLSSATSATNTSPSANTPAGTPNPRINATKPLSAGQIAGIVLGSFFFLLLLLLLLLCCLRRRRRQRQDAKILAAATGGGAGLSEKAPESVSRAGGGARGNYAALGAGAGAAGVAGLGAAAAARGKRGSLTSDDWEEDHLTGGGQGSGFFVVGGRRVGSDRQGSYASRRSVRESPAGTAGPSYVTSSIPPPAHPTSDGGRLSGFAGLAAAGAGFLGAVFGRNKGKTTPRTEIEDEQPLSDDDLGDGSIVERRGLLPFHDSPGGAERGYGELHDMREGGRSVSGPATALMGGAAGGTIAANRSRHDSGVRSQYLPGYGGADMNRPTSSAFSGSGTSSSGGPGSGSNATGATHSTQTQRPGGGSAGGISSSNSTGGFTTSGSGQSLPPPPRAPRTSPAQTMAYANVDPSSPSITETTGPSPALMTGQNPRFSVDTADSTSIATGGLNPSLMGLGAGVALGGLGALAAGHRESDSSTYSRRPHDIRDSNASVMSAEELGHLRATDPERYSRFISTGSNLLGPDYQPSPELDSDAKPSPDMGTGTMDVATGASFQRARLPTIRSVGEFGEKDSTLSSRHTQSTGDRTTSSNPLSSMHAVSANSGSLGASSGSRHVMSPLPVYEAHQLQAGESLPTYTQRRPSEGETFATPLTENPAQFVTPPASPRNTLGGRLSEDAQRYADASDSDHGPRAAQHDDGGAELAEAGVASAGILGGVAAGWRRLTMGQYAWIPGQSPSRAGHQGSSSGDLDDPEGRISSDHMQRPSEDSSRLIHNNRRASRLDTSDAGLAPDVRSERASVYGPSALGHNTSRSSPIAQFSSSKEASGSSGEKPAEGARQRSYPSLSSQNSRGGGYAASHSNSSMSGRRGAPSASSDSTGLDSLSAVAQLSSRSTGSSGYRSSSSRGGRSRGIASEASLNSGASTGAASYSPSGVLTRENTRSTRGFDESLPTGGATYGASRQSYETDLADGGGGSSMDIASSRATGGGSGSGSGSGGSGERRKRPRSSSVDGLSRLDSLREACEENDPFGDAEGDVPPLPEGGHYPSASLGAAISRLSARPVRQDASSPAATLGHDQQASTSSNPLPQRNRLRSLQPGAAGLAPTALAPSLSTPSLPSGSDSEAAAPRGIPSSSSAPLASMPASASWRPSPRVASAAERAQASLMRGQGGPTPPRSEAGAGGASFQWADLDTTFRRPDLEHGAEEQRGDDEEQPADTSKSFDWPKFLRF